MKSTNLENVTYKCCSKCNKIKNIKDFYKHGGCCCECNNINRRIKYNNDEEYRKKIIQNACNFKRKKVIERQLIKQEEQLKIGLENKQCKYCNKIKEKNMFRYNRLKCRDCERDDPKEKFKRYIMNAFVRFVNDFDPCLIIFVHIFSKLFL